jgi:hypothetical protein
VDDNKEVGPNQGGEMTFEYFIPDSPDLNNRQSYMDVQNEVEDHMEFEETRYHHHALGRDRLQT